MGVKSKGVSNIRTLAAIRGSGVHSSERHVHQFQIASLELERTRRMQERESTLTRLRSVEERIAGIEEQIRQHQQTLGVPGALPEKNMPVPAAPEAKAEQPSKRHKMRY